MDPTRLDEALHDRQDKAVRLQIRRGWGRLINNGDAAGRVGD